MANFLQKIKTYDKDNVSPSIIAKVKKYVTQPDFSAEEVKKISAAASTLCVWVHAIYIYANVAKEVAPKRQRLKEAMDGLAGKQAALKIAQAALAEVTEKVNKLKLRYDESVGQKNKLREEAEGLEAKLNRADQLVGGLSGEYTRWQNSIGGYRAAIADLVGDCLVASAFLSYAGPFDTIYRENLVKIWLAEVKDKALPFSQAFNFSLFLAKPTDVREWNIQGLPSDNFSTENGVIVTRGSRWPLMIDPQMQANRWIRNLEGKRLRVIDLKMKDFLREVENGISYGLPVLLQDVLEELDPSLEPVLSKAIMKQGSREFIRLGDKELDYSRDFRLYITTKLSNPHYTPEVSTKTTVVNFAVKQQGLEAQLLGIVVQKEQPALEKQKSELVIRVAAGKRKLVDLENLILRLLSESTGSLLDDEALVKTLQQSKTTSEEVTEQLKVAEETEKKIDLARESYRSAAIRASIAYFVLDDMCRIDPMYASSLESYVDLFNASIDGSRDPSSSTEHIGERCKSINVYHTLAVYQYVCRGLFERHKLLFSFQLCVRIMQSEHKIPKQEFDFFCFGSAVTDRTEQKPNPCPDWIDALMWDNITELDKVPALMGLASSVEQSPKDWKKWFMSAKPEMERLPADWSNKLSEIQQMCIMRCLRLDRVLFAATRFVASNLGTDYADPPAFDLKSIFKTSSSKTPLIFVLSPGVDPTAQVLQLASSINVRVENCALGQGQAPVAVRMIEEGLAEGKWVFLANCHLMLSWMPALEKIIEAYCDGAPNSRYRLWLSSSPHPQFPITILQRGIKMTTEPPRGLRANMLKLYNLVTPEHFERCKSQGKYKQLLFALCWFHALLLERRKFKSLGFNIPYDFNESDFSICHDLVIVFLDEYQDRTPFDAMRYLIAEANYGGRVTDDWDRRLVNVYINQFLCPEAIEQENFPLSELPEYFIPADGDLNSYKEFIKTLPQTDHPAAFGQHPNADISSQIEDTVDLLSTIVALQPRAVTDGGESRESVVARQAENMAEQVPALFDVRAIRASLDTRPDPDPLKVVLLQEVGRYNKLLGVLHRMLKDTKAAVSGQVVVTPELEDVMACLLEFRVPKSWSFCYPSTKPLGSWTRDLGHRCALFQGWVADGMPKVFWLPGFTYPSGFLTALLQTTARKNGLAIDSLSWEFPVLNQSMASISSQPKEGAYLNGFFLEGARWDADNACLGEPLPMELTSSMPIIHFKPVDNKKKVGKGVYVCPLYMYPVRTGTRERPSFVIAVELKSGKVNADFWVKRGTALLLATSQ